VNESGFSLRFTCLLALIGCFVPEFALAQTPMMTDSRLLLAQKLDQDGDLIRAYEKYLEYLIAFPDDSAAKQSLGRIARQIKQQLRLSNPDYRKLLLDLRSSQAIDLYMHVVDLLVNNFVEPNSARPNLLFQHGLDEIGFLLQRPIALEPILGALEFPEDSRLNEILQRFRARQIPSSSELREHLLEFLGEIKQLSLTQKSTRFTNLLVMELAHGACHGLDEYTIFLNPSDKRILEQGIAGKVPSVGLQLKLANQFLEVSSVMPGSPAQEAGLQKGDQIHALQGIAASELTLPQARGLLAGMEGTELLVHIRNEGASMPMEFRLTRRLLNSPSVDFEMEAVADLPVGWIRVSHFQSTTSSELREALAQLQTAGAHGLMLDLRGNPGGHFKSALSSAESFLSQGVLAQCESQWKEFQKMFTSAGVSPCVLPMVILIDQDTASSAEMIAMALKENGRARVVGVKSRGKGTIQCLVPLDKAPWDKLPGGIHLTVARMKSPTGTSLDQGIQPDITVEGNTEVLATSAKVELLRLLGKIPEMK